MEAPARATLTIGIPTYNRKRQLLRLLDALTPLRDAICAGRIRVHVSDNASDDGTEEAVRVHVLFAVMHYTRQPRNIGGTANIQSIIAVFDSAYLLLVGDDDVVLPDGVRATVQVLETQRPDWCLINVGNLDGRPVLRHLPADRVLEGPVIAHVGTSGLNNELGYFGCCILSRRAATAVVAAWQSGELCMADRWPSVHMFFFLVGRGGGLVSTYCPVRVVADAGHWDVAMWFSISRADIADIVQAHAARGVIDGATSARIRRQLLNTGTERQLLLLGALLARDTNLMREAIQRIRHGHGDVLGAGQRACYRAVQMVPGIITRCLRPFVVASYAVLYRGFYIQLLNRLRAKKREDLLQGLV